jgi:hypothetical protein
MTTDAGMQAIAGRFAPPAPAAGVDIEADLAVQIGTLAAEFKMDRQRRAVLDQKMQQAIRGGIPLLSVTQAAATPATFASSDWVCKTGYDWAIQLVTAKNLGSTDTLWVYKTSASGIAEIADSAAKWQLTNAAPGWHPGRTGLVLHPGDGIVLQGTTTQQVTVNIETIILESWITPDYLL